MLPEGRLQSVPKNFPEKICEDPLISLQLSFRMRAFKMAGFCKSLMSPTPQRPSNSNSWLKMWKN